ncbi:MAG: hypothetical protein AABZ55_03020 [Bdellovibrionota bacterium]
MRWFLTLPFAAQGLAMLFDEFWFHRARSLPRWERIGHPMDSLSVLLCYFFIFLNSPTYSNLYIYIGLCLFSCILVTKDEFVHKLECNSGELWLHSVLFILHPVVFGAAGFIWFLEAPIQSRLFNLLIGQSFVILIFSLYQTVYWNFLWKPTLK